MRKPAEVHLDDKRVTLERCQTGLRLQMWSRIGGTISMLMTRGEALRWWADCGELFLDVELDAIERERGWVVRKGMGSTSNRQLHPEAIRAAEKIGAMFRSTDLIIAEADSGQTVAEIVDEAVRRACKQKLVQLKQ